MSEQNFDWNQVSPMAMWRDWVAKSEAQWSESVAKVMQDPKASGAMGRQVEEARLAQRMFAEMAQASLAVVNLPSRSDLEGLDERMGRIEDGLAMLSAELVRMRQAITAAGMAAVAAPMPPRNRKAVAVKAAAPSAAPAAPPAAPATAGPNARPAKRTASSARKR